MIKTNGHISDFLLKIVLSQRSESEWSACQDLSYILYPSVKIPVFKLIL